MANRMNPLSLRRTMLFVPGNRADRFAKAYASGADMICLDLEDSVPLDAKVTARRAVKDWLAADIECAPETVVRINSVRTRQGLEDLLALAESGPRPTCIAVPKVESAAELRIVQGVLATDASGPALVAMIESLRGLQEVRSIGRAPGVSILTLGTADIAAEMRVTMEWEPLLLARLQLVQAAKAAGVVAMDGAWIKLDDLLGLKEQTRRSLQLGFEAMPCLHPRQVTAVHEVMMPTTEELANDEALVAAFESSDGGAIRHQGGILDLPVVNAARRRLEMARRSGATIGIPKAAG